MQSFSWEQLATVSGATALVTMIVQLVKADMNKVVVRVITYVLSLAVLVVSNLAANSPLTWETLLLAAINAIVVALTATGSYHTMVKPFQKDK